MYGGTGDARPISGAAAPARAAPEGRRGNSGRNQFRGPAYQNWDISLRKQIRMTSRYRLQFQVDFFNAFNQVIYGNPGTSVTTNGFGSITSAQVMRNVQMGFRLYF